MAGRSESLQNITMAGGGVYSLATRGAEDVINKSIPLVIDALNSMSIPEDQADFTFTDMGTADGGTSLKMVEKLIPKHFFLLLLWYIKKESVFILSML